MAKQITAANVKMVLVADILYPTGKNIDGFANDSLRSLDDLTLSESVMGVDGKLSHGFVKNPVTINLDLMPDQQGYKTFDNISQHMRTFNTILTLSLTIIDPTLNKKYTLTNGALTSWKAMPDATSTMQASTATMTFQDCVSEEYEA